MVRLYRIEYLSWEKLNLVFEFLDERDLRHFMLKRSPLSNEPDLLRSFSWQLLRGLDHLHKSRIIHRDLKPANLLINHRFELKIADYGLSRALEFPLRAYTPNTVWFFFVD